MSDRPALDRRREAVAEARRVLELAERHQLAFEFTAAGWQMIPAVPDLAALPPLAL